MPKIDQENYLYYWRLWHHNRDESDCEVIRTLCDPDLTHVLEIGCGDGRIGLSLAPYCKLVCGIDIDTTLIAAAREKACELDYGNTRFECMNAEQLDFDDEQFDRVVYAWSLHMVKNPLAAMQEAFRVLREDGLLVIIGLLSENEYDRIVAEFAGARTIDVQRKYELPILHAFGKGAIRLQRKQLFTYGFSNLDQAEDAFVFALDHWYGKTLTLDERQRLRSLLEELQRDGSIKIDFPANVYIVGKK